MNPYIARCMLLGSTGESPWSTTISAETPDRALGIGISAADIYADNLNVSRSKVQLYRGPICLIEEA